MELSKEVKLNVGGQAFSTTFQTLTLVKDSYFHSLLTRWKVEETIFIDRDGTHFRHVLNYLRGCMVSPHYLEWKLELAQEATFYGLSLATQLLQEAREQGQHPPKSYLPSDHTCLLCASEPTVNATTSIAIFELPYVKNKEIQSHQVTFNGIPWYITFSFFMTSTLRVDCRYITCKPNPDKAEKFSLFLFCPNNDKLPIHAAWTWQFLAGFASKKIGTSYAHTFTSNGYGIGSPSVGYICDIPSLLVNGKLRIETTFTECYSK